MLSSSYKSQIRLKLEISIRMAEQGEYNGWHEDTIKELEEHGDEIGAESLRRVHDIWQRWMEASKENNRIEAALQKEQEIESQSLDLEHRYLSLYMTDKWPVSRNAPPFLIPENEENAETINLILIKSMITQACGTPGIDQINKTLVTTSALAIHGFLAYYFKHIPGITVNIKRIIGLLDTWDLGAMPYSWLKIGGHYIDNTHEENKWFDKSWLLNEQMGHRRIDEDPGTTELGFYGDASDLKLTGGIGSKKYRLVCGKDEKMEQRMAYLASIHFVIGFTLYDIEMRRFIKEAHDVEIKSLTYCTTTHEHCTLGSALCGAIVIGASNRSLATS